MNSRPIPRSSSAPSCGPSAPTISTSRRAGTSSTRTRCRGICRGASSCAMAERLLAADWARYPDFHADELRRDLGRLHGHPAEGVLVGNGSNELLSVALTALVAPGGEVLGAEPSFGLYPGFVLKAGGVPRFLPPRPDLRIPADELEAEVERAPRRPLLLCTPNNPTGDALPVERVERLLERLEAPLLLDNAYGEFCRFDYRPLLARYPHLDPLPHLLQGLVARRHAARLPAGRSPAGRRADQGEAAVQPRPRGGDRRPRGARGRRRGGAPGAPAGGPPAAVGRDAGRGGVRGLPVRGELRADPHPAEGAGARRCSGSSPSGGSGCATSAAIPGSPAACGCRWGPAPRCGRCGRPSGESSG